MSDDQLVRDLIALGRTADVPAPSPNLAPAVLARVDAPVARPARRRLAVVAGAVVAVLLALLAAPPVRAAVADWFGFAGVIVERDDSSHDSAPPPADVTGDTAVSVDFPVYVPVALGEPDGTEVSDDGRIVSMSWTTENGVVRLDQFDGRIDYTMIKAVPDISYATVDGTDALWFDDAHEVTVLREDGTPFPQSTRLAGHTLIWPMGDTTLRLEGDLVLGEAIEIAESMERPAEPID